MRASFLSEIKKVFFHTLFPPSCIACGREGELCCKICEERIPLLQTQVCPGCEKPSALGKVCPSCHSRFSFDGLLVATDYRAKNPAIKLIKSLKYRSSVTFSSILSKFIVQVLGIFPSLKHNVIVPVPLFWKRKLDRGFNQAELLATLVSTSLKIPVENLLEKRKSTKAQVALRREERWKNVVGAFVCKKDWLNPEIRYLLIDDVCSTGATLHDCARALRKSGAKSVWGVVIARSLLGTE